MHSDTHRNIYDLIASILTDAETEGFQPGVDKHLHIQEILARLPDDVPIENIKYILAPLIVTDPFGQEQFYEICDRNVRLMQQKMEGDIQPRKDNNKTWRWLIPLLAGLALLLSLFPVYDILRQLFEEETTIQRYTAEHSLMAGSSDTICPTDSILQHFGTILVASPCNVSDTTSLYGTFAVQQNGCIVYSANTNIGADSVCLVGYNNDNTPANIIYKITITETDSTLEPTDTAYSPTLAGYCHIP